MSTGIIILVIVLILLLVGLGVILYFAFRKTDGPTGTPPGAPGNGGFTALQPIGGFTPLPTPTPIGGTGGFAPLPIPVPIGGTGGFTGLQPITSPIPTQPVVKDFAVILKSLNSEYWTIEPNPDPNNPGPPFLALQPPGSRPCEEYLFEYTNITNPNLSNVLLWKKDGKSILCSDGLPRNNVSPSIQLIDPTTTSVSSSLCSWTYDSERFTWQLANNSSLVMSPALPQRGIIVLKTLPSNFDSLPESQKAPYQWIQISVPCS